MASAVSLRGDSAAELRGLAAATKNANQSRRLLSLAAVVDGMNRTEAARIVGRALLRGEFEPNAFSDLQFARLPAGGVAERVKLMPARKAAASGSSRSSGFDRSIILVPRLTALLSDKPQNGRRRKT
jgi:hypothetical protein